ncbi:AAA family ATPase [Marinilabiliaceae bacterium JC017]|nr:AAA family ATPase [Marinilabiliaceae bacterium JC017]
MDESRKIIFIGGVHGVGKGTFCKKLQEEIKIEHLVSSELIKWSEITQKANDKMVKDVGFTQDRLVMALDKICNNNQTYLLDGHFCLIDKNNRPIKVPLDTFKRINPQKLLLLIDSVDSIKKRLEKRDEKIYDELIICDLQNSEIAYAKHLSKELNCELIIFSCNEYSDLKNKLKTSL